MAVIRALLKGGVLGFNMLAHDCYPTNCGESAVVCTLRGPNNSQPLFWPAVCHFKPVLGDLRRSAPYFAAAVAIGARPSRPLESS